MKTSVIIVNHNTPKLTADCVASLRRHLGSAVEIIIVSNGRDAYRPNEKEVPIKTIELGKNIGFGASNNRGVREATGDILWFLNTDTLVVDITVGNLLHFISRHKDIGMVTPLLFNDRQCRRLQSDFMARRQTLGNLLLRRAQPKFNIDGREFIEADVIVGASMLMRREVFEELGGFDEKIFMYLEDDDLCFKAQKAGYRVGVYTKARVVHLQGQSIKSNRRRKRLYYESQNYFWRKHYGVAMMWLMRALRWPLKFAKTI